VPKQLKLIINNIISDLQINLMKLFQITNNYKEKLWKILFNMPDFLKILTKHKKHKFNNIVEALKIIKCTEISLAIVIIIFLNVFFSFVKNFFFNSLILSNKLFKLTNIYDCKLIIFYYLYKNLKFIRILNHFQI